jgi:hypothetical protein
VSRQGAIIGTLIVMGLACVGVWAAVTRDRPMTAGLWFEDIPAEDTTALADGLGSAITPTDLKRIEAVALAELRHAFANTRLVVARSRSGTYHVRVVHQLAGGLRASIPVAGASRPVPGGRGVGAVNFIVLASSAIHYAPAGATRETIIDAIGRGIGRSAAHEIAHQILGSYPLHATTDRRSYEYEDVRREHFYGDLHWGVAGERLQARIGVRPSRRGEL